MCLHQIRLMVQYSLCWDRAMHVENYPMFAKADPAASGVQWLRCQSANCVISSILGSTVPLGKSHTIMFLSLQNGTGVIIRVLLSVTNNSPSGKF